MRWTEQYSSDLFGRKLFTGELFTVEQFNSHVPSWIKYPNNSKSHDFYISWHQNEVEGQELKQKLNGKRTGSRPEVDRKC